LVEDEEEEKEGPARARARARAGAEAAPAVLGLQSIRGLKRDWKRSEKGGVLEWLRGRLGNLRESQKGGWPGLG
jgi:hypothetical protein